MRARATMTSTPTWPAVLAAPLYDPARQPSGGDQPSRSHRQHDVGPIELRIGGGDGPAAIAILE